MALIPQRLGGMNLTLTIEQRDRIRAILPTYPQKPIGRKRADTVQGLEGILWLLTSGARWEDIDKKKYASFQTCHRYFQEWVQAGVFQKALEALVLELEDEKLLKLHESFLDGCFVPARKGRGCWPDPPG